MDLLVEQSQRGTGLKGHLPGQHLEEDYAQGIDIGTRIDRSHIDLLGRHVVGSAYDLADIGQRVVTCQPARSERRKRRFQAAVEELGDAEIRQQELAAVASGYKHILWLHVAMTNAV